MSDDDLLRCPFCVSSVTELRDNSDTGDWFVLCVGCEARGPTGDHPSEAELAWNRLSREKTAVEMTLSELGEVIVNQVEACVLLTQKGDDRRLTTKGAVIEVVALLFGAIDKLEKQHGCVLERKRPE